jgi:predicted glutamine amidotransferase
MNCRMLVAAGKLPIPKILNAFKLMATNKNEKHEVNINRPDFRHGDGWGIVYSKNNKLEWYKNTVPCWEDPKYNEYYSLNTQFLILHARKASQGSPISYEFTHPFEKNGWFFCHNGTIYDFLDKNRSDSETFFMLLLSKLEEKRDIVVAIKNAVNTVKKFTALNFILANREKVYAVNLFIDESLKAYYTMKYLQSASYVIIASERLSLGRKWNEVGNNTLIELDVKNLEFETVKLK